MRAEAPPIEQIATVPKIRLRGVGLRYGAGQTAVEALVAAGFPWDPADPVPTLFRPVGCPVCAKTGYKGRVALHEVMTVSEEIERLTVARASGAAIAEAARSQGMVTLRMDGMAKVADGTTSIDEILRVVV